MIPFGKRPKKLPAVLSGEEVNQTAVVCEVSQTSHVSARAVCVRNASERSGSSEISDIDSQRMQLRIGCGQRPEDANRPDGTATAAALREYWKAYRPAVYLFPGKSPDVPLQPTTIQKMFKVAAKEAGILKDVTPHTLRHSYATGLLEAGVDLLAISRLLGHASFSTTMIYLHVRTLHLGSAPSPIDWLPIRQLPGWMQPPESKA
jgi:integrase/recombinase XerD